MDVLAIKQSRVNRAINLPKQKKKIVLLSALGIIDFSIISLYQLGAIKKLPDLPFTIFDSNKVNASKEARIFGIPDGPISLATYAATILLAVTSSTHKKKNKLLKLALAGTVLGNAIGAGYYLFNMINVQKKACIYCLIGAAINFALVPFAIKDLKEDNNGKILV